MRDARIEMAEVTHRDLGQLAKLLRAKKDEIELGQV